MGPKCMARGCGGLLMLGDMGRKGVGDAYPPVWKGREKCPLRVLERSATSMLGSGSRLHRWHPLPEQRGPMARR